MSDKPETRIFVPEPHGGLGESLITFVNSEGETTYEVDLAELQELVKEFRDQAEECIESNDLLKEEAIAFQYCAKELEDVIDD